MSKLSSRLRTYIALTNGHERKVHVGNTNVCCGCTWDSIGPPRTRILICGYATAVFAFATGLVCIITGVVLSLKDLIVLGALLLVGGVMFCVLFIVQQKPHHGCSKVRDMQEVAVEAKAPTHVVTKKKELNRRPSDFLRDSVPSSKQWSGGSDKSEFTQSLRGFDQHTTGTNAPNTSSSYPPTIQEEEYKTPVWTTTDTITTVTNEHNTTEHVELNETIPKELRQLAEPSYVVTEIPVPSYSETEMTGGDELYSDDDIAPPYIGTERSEESQDPVHPSATRTENAGHVTFTPAYNREDNLTPELTEHAELEPGHAEGTATAHSSNKKKKRKKKKQVVQGITDTITADNGASFRTSGSSEDGAINTPDQTHIPYESLA